VTHYRISAVKGNVYRCLLSVGQPPVSRYEMTPNGAIPKGLNAIANQFYCSPIIVPVDAILKDMGIILETIESGNIILGLLNSVNFLPETKAAETVSTDVTTLTQQRWGWIAPTSEVFLRAGLYYLGIICDTAYNVGVAGIRYAFTGNNNPNGNNNYNGLHEATYGEAVGAFSVPDPMTEGLQSQRYYLSMMMQVEPIHGVVT